MRAASAAATAAFALSALAVLLFYAVALSVHPGDAAATALGLGLVAFGTVFIAVCVVAAVRRPSDGPVLGARRGAIIAIVALVAVASAHALSTFGSGGLTYSLIGQVGYACVIGGGPAAIAGALLGRAIERRVFMVRGP